VAKRFVGGHVPASMLLIAALFTFPATSEARTQEVPSGISIGEIDTGSASAWFATSDPESGEVWLATGAENFQLLAVDPESLTVTDTFRVSRNSYFFPTGLAFAPSTSTVWATGPRTVAQVDAESKTVIRTIDPFPPGSYNKIQSLAASPSDGSLWFGAERTVFRMDPSTGSIAEAIPSLGPEYQPKAIAVSPIDERVLVLWVQCQEGRAPDGSLTCLRRSNRVVKYDSTTLQLLGSFDIPNDGNHYANDFTLAPDGATGFVSIAERVFAIDIATMTGQNLGDLDFGEIHQVEVSPDGSALWLGSPTGLRKVDLHTGQVLGPATTVNGDRVGGNLCLSVTPDGATVFSCQGRTLAVVRPSNPPSAPRNLKGWPTKDGIVATWDAPERTGELQDLIVQVTALPGGQQCTSRGESCRLRGLKAGQQTTLTAVASNALGESDLVRAPELLQYLSTPGSPRQVRATRRGSQAVIRWKPPKKTGGSVITGYVVTVSSGRQQCSTKRKTQCVIRDLPVGDTYRFSVTALNAMGEGQPATSRQVNFPIPPVPPPPPKPEQQFN